MLFNFKSDDDVFKSNPELSTIPEFSNLTDRQMKYVILSTDYKSPFRQLPDQDKKEKAALQAGYKYEHQYGRLDRNGRDVVNGKVQSIEKAIDKYKEIQFDMDRDLLVALDAQIQSNIDLMKKPNKSAQEMKLANEYVSKHMVELTKQRKELLKILDLNDEPIPESIENEEGTKRKSRLDKRNEAITKNA